MGDRPVFPEGDECSIHNTINLDAGEAGEDGLGGGIQGRIAEANQGDLADGALDGVGLLHGEEGVLQKADVEQEGLLGEAGRDGDEVSTLRGGNISLTKMLAIII